jgi:hypothetical protein
MNIPLPRSSELEEKGIVANSLRQLNIMGTGLDLGLELMGRILA